MLKLQSLGFGGKASAVMEAATAVMLSSGGGDAAAHSASASSSAAVAELAAEKGANADEGDREGRGGGDADAAAVGEAGESEGKSESESATYSPRTRAKKTTLESMNVLELFALRGNPFSDDFFELLAIEMSESGGSGSAVHSVTHGEFLRCTVLTFDFDCVYANPPHNLTLTRSPVTCCLLFI